MNKDKNDYKIIFGGAAISPKEAKKAGVALIFGVIGIIAIGLSIGIANKTHMFIVAFLLVGIGYGVASKIFKN